jgi:hypothetical protein
VRPEVEGDGDGNGDGDGHYPGILNSMYNGEEWRFERSAFSFEACCSVVDTVS